MKFGRRLGNYILKFIKGKNKHLLNQNNSLFAKVIYCD